MLFIVEVITFIKVDFLWLVRIRRLLLPLTLAVLAATIKVASIDVAISPGVLSVALGQSLRILPRVLIAIMKEVSAVALPQTRLPLTLVPVTIQPRVYAITIGLIGLPRANVAVHFGTLPDAVTLFHALSEGALVGLPVGPAVEALAVSLAIEILSLVGVA